MYLLCAHREQNFYYGIIGNGGGATIMSFKEKCKKEGVE